MKKTEKNFDMKVLSDLGHFGKTVGLMLVISENDQAHLSLDGDYNTSG